MKYGEHKIVTEEQAKELGFSIITFFYRKSERWMLDRAIADQQGKILLVSNPKNTEELAIARPSSTLNQIK